MLFSPGKDAAELLQLALGQVIESERLENPSREPIQISPLAAPPADAAGGELARSGPQRFGPQLRLLDLAELGVEVPSVVDPAKGSQHLIEFRVGQIEARLVGSQGLAVDRMAFGVGLDGVKAMGTEPLPGEVPFPTIEAELCLGHESILSLGERSRLESTAGRSIGVDIAIRALGPMIGHEIALRRCALGMGDAGEMNA